MMSQPLNVPYAVDLLDGMSLKGAFWQFVLRDPEVQRLASKAIKANSDLKRVYEDGWCYPSGCREWPVAFNQGGLAGGRSENSPVGCLEGPASLAVQRAADVVCLRYASLLTLLRDGQLIAIGDSVRSRGTDEILPSIWSHRSYHFDANSGDLLQTNDKAVELSAVRVKRWRAVLLKRPTMFPVKPPVFDLVRAPTLEPQRVLVPSSKAIKRFETTATSKKACTEWLVAIMRASPNNRTESKSGLWIKAQEIWPGTLSERAFIAARTAAIALVPAPAWGAAGAPKKAQRKSPR